MHANNIVEYLIKRGGGEMLVTTITKLHDVFSCRYVSMFTEANSRRNNNIKRFKTALKRCLLILLTPYMSPMWRRQKREPSSLRWDSNIWLWVLRDSDHWQFALTITDPSSRQRGRPKTKIKAIIRQKKGKRRMWSWVPNGCPTPRRIGRLTFGLTSTQLHTWIFQDKQ
jgi:hypothetical protein